ncbi:hypothetical protein RHCRD62_10535 [Rhodococcus sp. RD6.2]|nr:hypothetical protein RHCRD62_10535 [Rhodococcus sp. RD6.2]
MVRLFVGTFAEVSTNTADKSYVLHHDRPYGGPVAIRVDVVSER